MSNDKERRGRIDYVGHFADERFIYAIVFRLETIGNLAISVKETSTSRIVEFV